MDLVSPELILWLVQICFKNGHNFQEWRYFQNWAYLCAVARKKPNALLKLLLHSIFTIISVHWTTLCRHHIILHSLNNKCSLDDTM